MLWKVFFPHAAFKLSNADRGKPYFINLCKVFSQKRPVYRIFLLNLKFEQTGCL